MVAALEQEKPLVTDAPQQAPTEVLVPLENEVQADLSKLEGYLEQIEQQKGSAVTDDAGKPALTPTGDDKVTITLPLTEDQVRDGLHHKIIDSVRWLAEWCILVIKKAHGVGVRVIYRK
ncbi:MAG: hypothetical protein Q7S79_02060 [bacterium]|nr:hypothetical protein [bacterium]